jgi:S-DNA-T family DNA segregation ATPase FtsK/SpoIIIE
MARIPYWFRGPVAWLTALFANIAARFRAWKHERASRARELAEKRVVRRSMAKKQQAPMEETPPIVDQRADPETPEPEFSRGAWPIEDIPIRTLEMTPATPESEPPWGAVEAAQPTPQRAARGGEPPRKARTEFKFPPTSLLHEHPGRSAYDTQELKETAAKIKSKFEEFNVLGSVTQINPGPVVTTFEFKPEAGVKYSRITTLT